MPPLTARPLPLRELAAVDGDLLAERIGTVLRRDVRHEGDEIIEQHPGTPKTVYRIGSITKQFTSAASCG
jgi:CubicO group peptidase (beta-lactamase class C family)